MAGHICLDIIPGLEGMCGVLAANLTPGKLVNIGPAVVSTGGPVSNTGLALHRLGIPVSLMGKVGNDIIGRTVLEVLARHGKSLAEGMIVAEGEHTSYTVVLSPPKIDRIFLHCTGANDTFSAEDIDYGALAGARLFHFGYPPLMKRMYEDGGDQLAGLLRRAKAAGPSTSLDMAFVDPASEAGKADWPAILGKALPHVDVFVPSLDEILFMLDRARFGASRRPRARTTCSHTLMANCWPNFPGGSFPWARRWRCSSWATRALYLRTTSDARRLAAVGPCNLDAAKWRGRELLAPCFEVKVVGTTGSGDCTIAGFLAALLHGLSPEGSMTAAVGTGACSVEAADATSGIPHWQKVQERIAAGWKRREVSIALEGWKKNEGVFVGPNDRG